MATSGKRCRDPPFLTYIRPENGGIMSGKFSGYCSDDDMMTDYGAGIVEAQRVLKPKGVLVFKCQDTVHNHRLQLTHARICSLAEEQGFRLQDLFILVTTNRLPVRAAPHGRQVQRHARVHHSSSSGVPQTVIGAAHRSALRPRTSEHLSSQANIEMPCQCNPWSR